MGRGKVQAAMADSQRRKDPPQNFVENVGMMSDKGRKLQRSAGKAGRGVRMVKHNCTTASLARRGADCPNWGLGVEALLWG